MYAPDFHLQTCYSSLSNKFWLSGIQFLLVPNSACTKACWAGLHCAKAISRSIPSLTQDILINPQSSSTQQRTNNDGLSLILHKIVSSILFHRKTETERLNLPITLQMPMFAVVYK